MGIDAAAAVGLFLAAVFRPERIRNIIACWVAVGLFACSAVLHGLVLGTLSPPATICFTGLLDAAGLVAAAIAVFPRPQFKSEAQNPSEPPTTGVPS